jgi:poly(A) polymerase
MTEADKQKAPQSLRGQSWLERAEARAVFGALADAGFEARAVGGAVRNALMGQPIGDVDIATPARPDDVMRAAAAAGLKCVATGVEHGTVTVVSGHVAYEVTTLREDVETYGRHARIAFSTDWSADARRRDFTMNALYCTADGAVIDPLGGYADLVQRRVVFIGDARERIREDFLRILRFFRFHAEYARGEPERAAVEACVRERHGLAGLSAERVRSELLKLLGAANAVCAIRAMHDFGLLTSILGAAPRPGLFERLVEREGAWQAPSDALLRLSALAVAVEEDADRLGERLRLANAEREALIVVDTRAADVAAFGEAEARRALYGAGGEENWRRLVLAAAAATADVSDETWSRLRHLSERWVVPRFPLRGADALELGMPPGPEVGRVLHDLERWWIEGDFAADETALRVRLGQTIRPQ